MFNIHLIETMKKFILSICCVAAMCTASAQESHIFPDSLYLFSYFTNKDANRHGMHYAWSRDGYEWNTVGNPVGFLQPDTASDAPRLRDPFLLQDKKGMWHCVWTTDWESPHIGYASSPDLIHWSEPQLLYVMQSAGYEPRNCWAPEMLYDEENDRYLIFWASTIKVDGKWRTEEGKKYDNRMYYTATRDFKTFSPARPFLDYGYNVIDATVRRVGESYYMIYKDERELPSPHKYLLVATSKHAAGPYVPLTGKPFTPSWVEGPSFIRLPDGTFICYMDNYRKHRYSAMTTRDFIHWEEAPRKLSLPSGAAHGAVLKVPSSVVDTLLRYASGRFE